MKKVANVILCLGFLTACSHRQTLQPLAYMDKIEKSYSRKVTSGKTEYTIQYASPEFVACKELDGKPESNIAQYKKRVEELKGYVFFIIKIKSPFNTEGSANKMVMYYQQDASNDVKLLEGQNTSRPAVWNFENNYGLTPYNAIVIGFENNVNNNKGMQLVFNDNYTHVPMIKATFSENDLKNLPQLAIN